MGLRSVGRFSKFLAGTRYAASGGQETGESEAEQAVGDPQGAAPAATCPSEVSNVAQGKPRHKRSKDLSKCDEHGRLLPQFVKRKRFAGRFNPSRKRVVRRERYKRVYKRDALRQAAWRKTLRRRFSQNKSVATRYAAKHGLDPKDYYQLDLATFMLIWETAPKIYIPDKGWIEPKECIGNPFTNPSATYFDRLDRTKPFTRENCRVFRGGKPLCI